MEMEQMLNFKTSMPVPFKDAATGRNVFVECSATATVVVLNQDLYPDRGALNQRGGIKASTLLQDIICEMSGKENALELKDKAKDISRKLKDGLKAEGLEATSIEILKIGPDEDSENMLKMCSSVSPMPTDVSMNVSLSEEAALAMAAQMAMLAKAAKENNGSSAPKFCKYCGSPAGSKFCPNCGAKLV